MKTRKSYRRVLDRRTFLRGAGTVAIGLPFLNEMRATSVYADDPPPPERVLTFFFALGVPSPFQGDQYVRPFTEHMAPLAQVADKIALLRNVHFERGSNTTNNHARGSTSVFIGDERTGASIDQVALQELHGDVSPTLVRSLIAGTFSRQDGNLRHVHSWAGPNLPTAQPTESPQRLFNQVFGSFMPPPTDPDGAVDPAEVRRARYERSILDAAVSQYRYVTSERFGLSASSKSKISLHLDRIRELEQRIFDPDAQMMAPPPRVMGSCEPTGPGDFSHPEMVEIQRTVNNEGVRMDVNRWMALWHAMVDTYVLAVQCDVSRFGNLQFQSGGERIILYGDYTAYGQTRTFNDSETTHEYWHSWNDSPGNSDRLNMLDHIWLMMAELTYFLKKLDDPDYRDPNGGTLLDNALVLASTELGDGNPHNVEDVFHLATGCNGAIRPGIHDLDVQATQVYNAGLRAIGVDSVSMSGDSREAGRVASAMLA